MAYKKISGKKPRFLIKGVPVEFEKNGEYVSETVSIRYRDAIKIGEVKETQDMSKITDVLMDIFNVNESDIFDAGELFEILIQVIELVEPEKTPK